MKNNNVIGFGGGKGGGGGGGLVEDPDTLASSAFAKIVDLIGEGEIEGLVAGESSIFLDGIPLRNSDGSYNFDRFMWGSRPGTQDQSALPTFNTVESVVVVGTKVLFNGTGVVRSIADSGADFVRVTLNVPALSKTSSTGHISGAVIEFAIDVKPSDGAYSTIYEGKIEGKSRSTYSRALTFPLYGKQGVGPWQVRVRRLTADSASSTLQNDLFFETLSVINSEKLRYPNSALIGLMIDARIFDHVPQRTYHVRGVKVRIPKNYDPVTRTYATTGPGTTNGAWDGTFKAATYTNNPAWCFYDLITSKRYGLGSRVDPLTIDKWTLYRLAMYCDQMVPTGFASTNSSTNSTQSAVSDSGSARSIGTMMGSLEDSFKSNGQLYEPRFTLNCVLNTREDAYKVLNNLASVFRGMVYWSSGAVQFSQDSPSDAVNLYTQANVVDGRFNYNGSGKENRHTVALITWNDPSENFKPQVEYIDDPEGVMRYGINQTEQVAFGCTSRGQATRLGRWLLFTERMETEVVSFRAGLDAAFLRPGNVIKVADASVSGVRMGGRILTSTSTSVMIDNPINLAGAKTYTLSISLPDGTVARRQLTPNLNGSKSVLTFIAPLTVQPQADAVFVLAETNLNPQTYRIIGIKESSAGLYDVTALEHNTSKYNAIELGLSLEDPIISVPFDSRPGPVYDLKAETVPYQVNSTSMSTRISVSWADKAPVTANTVVNAGDRVEPTPSRYIVRYRTDSGNWVEAETLVNSFDIDDVVEGIYRIGVIAVSAYGLRSVPVYINHEVVIKATAYKVANLRLEYTFDHPDVAFTWDAYLGASEYEVEIWTGGFKRLTTNIAATRFVFTFAQNKGLQGPHRTVIIKVRVITPVARGTEQAELTATNSQIAAPTLSIIDTSGGLNITALKPVDADWAGTRIWIESTNTFDPLTTTPKYDSVSNVAQIEPLPSGIYFVCAAHYDIFGPDSLNVSSKVQAVVTSAASGVPRVNDPSTLTGPPGSEPPGGESKWAVFSNTNLKMWVWDSPSGTYKDVSDLGNGYFNLVAANKAAFAELSAISTNAGNLTAGTFTLDNLGFIRGGATNYMVGTGFWLGYHSDAYKVHVGNPAGAGFTWDGDVFTIRGANGNAILTAGSPSGDTSFGSSSAGANLIYNTGRKPTSTDAGWDYSTDNPAGWTTTFSHTIDTGTYSLPGERSRVVSFSSVYGSARWSTLPQKLLVSPGDRIEGSTYIGLDNAQGEIDVVWLNDSGIKIGSDTLGAVDLTETVKAPFERFNAENKATIIAKISSSKDMFGVHYIPLAQDFRQVGDGIGRAVILSARNKIRIGSVKSGVFGQLVHVYDYDGNYLGSETPNSVERNIAPLRLSYWVPHFVTQLFDGNSIVLHMSNGAGIFQSTSVANVLYLTDVTGVVKKDITSTLPANRYVSTACGCSDRMHFLVVTVTSDVGSEENPMWHLVKWTGSDAIVVEQGTFAAGASSFIGFNEFGPGPTSQALYSSAGGMLEADLTNLWFADQSGNGTVALFNIDHTIKVITKVYEGSRYPTTDGGIPASATFEGTEGVAVYAVDGIMITLTGNHMVVNVRSGIMALGARVENVPVPDGGSQLSSFTRVGGFALAPQYARYAYLDVVGRGVGVAGSTGALESVDTALTGNNENLFLYSEDYVNAYWNKTDLSVQAGVVDPLGGTSGARLTLINGASWPIFKRDPSTTDTSTYTFTFWVKGVGSSISKEIWCGNWNTSNSTDQQKRFTLTDTWQKVTLQFTPNSATPNTTYMGFAGLGAGAQVDIAFVQLYKGTVARDYVKTTVAKVVASSSTGALPVDSITRHSFAAVGNATLASSVMTFDGQGSWFEVLGVQTDWAFGTGPFNVKTSFKLAQLNCVVLDAFSPVAAGWKLQVTADGHVEWHGTSMLLRSTTTVSIDTVIAVEVSLVGSTLSMKINGTSVASTTSNFNYTHEPKLCIGAQVTSRDPASDMRGVVYSLTVVKSIITILSTGVPPGPAVSNTYASVSGVLRFTRSFMAVASRGQTALSPWSEGVPPDSISSVNPIQPESITSEMLDTVNWNKVTERSGLAALVQITNDNVDEALALKVIGGAYIDDLAVKSIHVDYAAIQRTHIGEASVDTLRIAGQAVTIPALYIGSSTTIDTDVETLIIATPSLNTEGGGAIIDFSCAMKSVTADATGRFVIRVNGLVYKTVPFGIQTNGADTNWYIPTSFGIGIDAGRYATITITVHAYCTQVFDGSWARFELNDPAITFMVGKR